MTRFYLACTRENLDGIVGFHCKEGRGYSCYIDNAHIYGKEEAQRAWDSGREIDLPLSQEHVDALSFYAFDMQNLPENPEKLVKPNSDYYAIYEHKYRGNLCYFFGKEGQITEKLSEAKSFSLIETLNLKTLDCENVTFYPKSLIDEKRVRVVNTFDINPRVMTQGQGIYQPKHVKQAKRKAYQRRNSKGLHRVHCTQCGTLTWSKNPYAEDVCSNPRCENYTTTIMRHYP